MGFSDDTDRNYIMSDVTVYRAKLQPCIVCGHSDGNCAGDLEPPDKILFHGTTPSLEAEQTVYVENDIYAERQIGGLTTVRFLVARKGTSVSFEKARELGII